MGFTVTTGHDKFRISLCGRQSITVLIVVWQSTLAHTGSLLDLWFHIIVLTFERCLLLPFNIHDILISKDMILHNYSSLAWSIQLGVQNLITYRPRTKWYLLVEVCRQYGEYFIGKTSSRLVKLELNPSYANLWRPRLETAGPECLTISFKKSGIIN